MIFFIICIFFIGYTAITLEHTIKIDKLIPAILMMAVSWATISLGIDSFNQWFDPQLGKLTDITLLQHEARSTLLEETLLHHFGKTAEILIFLMGAMAIVEMVDHFDGFGAIKKVIKTHKKSTLLWIISFLAFFLSAIIDNLTATIVIITIIRKIVPEQKDRMWFSGFIIIAANAGGALTPIGDVTTTMLWMAGKVTTGKLILLLGIPSLINLVVPLLMGSILPAFKGKLISSTDVETTNKYGTQMLLIGLGLIVFVPVFKTITHLPPYIGMMLSLAIFALIAEFLSNRTISFTNPSDAIEKSNYSGPTMAALGKIEMPSILFFLGILMTVAAMESLGIIFNFGQSVSAAMPENIFITILGASSAIIDNVPLVAASIGMFQNPPDTNIWYFIAYAAGTGGSMLIIGSAAGVVAMGMEKISFFWYLKNISLLALIGYLAGTGVFLLLSSF